MDKYNLKTPSARVKLPPRVHEPYWARVSGQLYVGYRVPRGGGRGTWLCRTRENGKQLYHALGSISDEANAHKIAVAQAMTWLEGLERGISNEVITVEEACREYVQDRRDEKPAAAQDAEGRFKRLIYGTRLGKTPLHKLKASSVKAWRAAQVDSGANEDTVRRAQESANRNLIALKAALNLAYKGGAVSSDVAWRSVSRYKDTSRRRDEFLSLEQRAALIAACPTDLANLIRGLLLTGLRPGELARCTVGDFNPAQGTLNIKGKTKYRENCTVSTAARDFFVLMAKDKLPKASLISRSNGTAWSKDSWKRPLRRAVTKAGLSEDVVLYCLRHTAISELIQSGLDAVIVAHLSGTSVDMISKFYLHLAHDRTRAKLDAVKML